MEVGLGICVFITTPPAPRGPEAGVWAMETLPLGRWAQLAGCRAEPLGESQAPGPRHPTALGGSTRHWQLALFCLLQKPKPEKEGPQFAIFVSRFFFFQIRLHFGAFSNLFPVRYSCSTWLMVESSVPFAEWEISQNRDSTFLCVKTQPNKQGEIPNPRIF